MKGQAGVVLSWIFGLVAIFTVMMVFYTMYPVISNNVGGYVLNNSGNLSSVEGVTNVVNTARIAVPVALMVLIGGVILYLILASTKREPQSDIL